MTSDCESVCCCSPSTPVERRCCPVAEGSPTHPHLHQQSVEVLRNLRRLHECGYEYNCKTVALALPSSKFEHDDEVCERGCALRPGQGGLFAAPPTAQGLIAEAAGDAGATGALGARRGVKKRPLFRKSARSTCNPPSP